MIAKQNFIQLFLVLIVGILHFNLYSQTTENSSKLNQLGFYELRGLNVLDAGTGTSIINGDLMDPKFEVYFHVGYKRYIFPYLNINVGYNKFNLAYNDGFNQGFMSFDLNLETTLLPNNKFSPFLFVGSGYNASNYFKQTAIKFQGGAGIEYMAIDHLGLKLYSDYNYVSSDELDGVVAGASDDTYFRIGLGINYYFGGTKKREKLLENEPSIINNNQIISHN